MHFDATLDITDGYAIWAEDDCDPGLIALVLDTEGITLRLLGTPAQVKGLLTALLEADPHG